MSPILTALAISFVATAFLCWAAAIIRGPNPWEVLRKSRANRAKLRCPHCGRLP